MSSAERQPPSFWLSPIAALNCVNPSATQRLMQAMHGSIEALPRSGGGARFVLTLPIAVADAEFEEDASPRAASLDAEPEAPPAAT